MANTFSVIILSIVITLLIWLVVFTFQVMLNNAKWARRWREEVSDPLFAQFCEQQFGAYSSIDYAGNVYKNDNDLWDKYDRYLHKYHNMTKAEKIKTQLQSLATRAYNDAVIRRSVGLKALQVQNKDGETEYTYVLLDMDNIVLRGNELKHYVKNGVYRYTIGRENRELFIDLFTKISQMESSQYESKNTHSYTQEKESHPKRRTYDILLNTIKQREEQLRMGKYNDNDKQSLENELRNAKSRLRRMKDRYGF